MVKKRMSLLVAASLFLILTAGCGKVFEVTGDILSLSVADTGKDEDDSYSSGEEELPKRQVTVKPTQESTSTPTPTPTPTEEPKEMVYCISPVNVRDAASTGSRVIGTLNTGDAVERLGQEGGWVKILYEGQEAYVYQDYVSSTRP